ncbi:DUF4142 domain-containing protein [Streptomyces sp. H10-C2]|uniref:DUF4142 domain-containing protein n=1 Tax=unclassified Streptomyces TaxID=2593676 RepID=UPI0024BBC937|nr:MULTISPECIES: DUF4142 domain-containing protein [unclassified Streptomyces]MDJ0344665.1 DUF4142 domain-containing protein [Streptomyces sp. PH10-H1]MDJ0372851.1 DUF4142 domain-containing protein [Streptomyces sp. H10-C2]
MRSSRHITGTGLVVGALAVTLAALLFPVMSSLRGGGTAGSGSSGAGGNAPTVATQYGPLSALDSEFVDKVRLAGLWETPAGQQAQERGTTQSVRLAGQHLIAGHTELDRQVRSVAAQLGIPLPNQPNDQQREWLAELSAATGQDYDRKFANILRLAHGRVFEVVAHIRATTRNSLVRELANQANATVLDHITVLEETGLVDFDAIAADAAAGTSSPSPKK